MSANPDADLAALDPRARRARPRTRIAVGAAGVVLVAAVAIAGAISFQSGGGGDQGVVGGRSAGSGSGAREPRVSATAGGAVGRVYVHVLGAVARPGLVILASGSRVMDAVAAAGGLTGEADSGGINLARPLVDGEQVQVPKVGEHQSAVEGGASGSGAQREAGADAARNGGSAAGGSAAKVNVNTAGLAELDTLPRIGPALAQRIVDYRAAHGPFRSLADLGKVAGLGDALLAGIRDRVVF